MILGIGTDIIDIRRIEKTILKYGDKFKNKCFLKSEIQKSENRINSTPSYAKIYAAKEACSKALGTGFRKGLNFNDISIINDKYGKPSIKLNNKLQNIIKKRFNTKKVNVYLSISDEKKHSVAFVILRKK